MAKSDGLAARGERAHRRPEVVAALDVHRDGRLVEHEQLRVGDERDREAHALGLAAGELLRAPVGDRPAMPASSSTSSTASGDG